MGKGVANCKFGESSDDFRFVIGIGVTFRQILGINPAQIPIIENVTHRFGFSKKVIMSIDPTTSGVQGTCLSGTLLILSSERTLGLLDVLPIFN